VSTAAIATAPSKGELAHNAMMVGMLQGALSSLDMNLASVPDLIGLIDKDNCWRAFKFPDQPEPTHWNAADFREFLRAKRPRGCETHEGILLRAVRDTPAAEIVERLLRGEPGGANNPTGNTTCGRDEQGRLTPVNRNNITVDRPDTIPFDPPPAPARDYSRESKQGTSTSYLLRQLANGRKIGGEPIPPRPDLLEKVRKGEMSPHGAAVAAGYVRPKITVDSDPVRASRVLLKRFQGDDLATLLRELANHAGYDLVERTD
jgi:hypothetical protein